MGDKYDNGVMIDDIILLNSSHSLNIDNINDNLVGVKIIDFTSTIRHGVMQTAVRFKIGGENKVFEIDCCFMAIYKKVGDTGLKLEDLTPSGQLTHIIAYLRSFASQLTSLMPMNKNFILPPINAMALYEEYLRDRQAEKVEVE